MSNLLVNLAKALDEAGIPYMLIGGQAVLIYGEPRLTRDIDVPRDLRTPDLGAAHPASAHGLAGGLSLFMDALRKAGFAACKARGH